VKKIMEKAGITAGREERSNLLAPGGQDDRGEGRMSAAAEAA
jgi:hypothetical protein